MNVRKNIKKKFPPSPKTDLGGGGGGGGGGRGPGYASGPGNSGHGDVPACRDLGTQVPPGIAFHRGWRTALTLTTVLLWGCF